MGEDDLVPRRARPPQLGRPGRNFDTRCFPESGKGIYCGKQSTTGWCSKLQKGKPVDVAFVIREITPSLIHMVLEQDEKHQGPLLAHIAGSLADEYLKRRGFIQSRKRRPARSGCVAFR